MSRVKSITSGDSLVLSDKNGERFVSLAYVIAPRVDSQQGGFTGRELLRKLLVGKPVEVRTIYTANERDFVDIRAPIFDSLVEKVLLDGAAKLRDDAPVKPGYDQVSIALENAQEAARTGHKGIWNAPAIRLEREAPKDLFGSGRQIPAIVEKVISGDRVIVRVLMDKDHHFYGLVSLAGIRAPRSTGPNGPADPYGDVARDLVAQRLLQRDIRCKFIANGSNGIPLVTLIHPAGDIATSLLSAGLARFADNQTAQVGSERSIELRRAEASAKTAGLNMWKANKEASKARVESASVVTVQKVLSSDTFVIDGDRTVQLSSISAPRRGHEDTGAWYDAAKEYARALVIGRQVEILIDGTRQDNERELVTMVLDGKNVAKHIVSSGYASVRRGQNQGASPVVVELALTEDKAKAQRVGIWGKAPVAAKQVDASESQVRAKAYLSSLERRGRIPGIVDYVAPQGARLRIVIPSENCIITAVCAGVRVPRSSEPASDLVSEYVHKTYLQRDVEVKVLGTDKTGAFTSQVFFPGKKQSLGSYLVSEGLASVFEPAANEYGLRKELDAEQESARDARKGIWVDYVPEELRPVEKEEDIHTTTETKPTTAGTAANYRDAIISFTTSNTVSYRLTNDDAKFKELSANMVKFFTAGANSAAHSFPRPPRRNDNVVYKNGMQFLRCQVLETAPFKLLCIDVGSTVNAKLEDLRPLPNEFSLATVHELATTEELAFIHAAPRDYLKYAEEYLAEICNTRVVVTSVSSGIIVYTEDSDSADDSINSRLIDNGYTYLRKGDGSPTYLRLKDMETRCMRDRAGIWEYGDPRDDEDDF